MKIPVETLQWLRIGAATIWLTLLTIAIFAGRAFMWHKELRSLLLGFALGSIGTAALLGFIVATNRMVP